MMINSITEESRKEPMSYDEYINSEKCNLDMQETLDDFEWADFFYYSYSDIGEEAMLYGHSDIKIYGTFASTYRGNNEILKKTIWFSSYEVAHKRALMSNTDCIAEAIINTDSLLDLLNAGGVNYVNNYYRWMKEQKVIVNSLNTDDVLKYMIKQSDFKFKVVRTLKEYDNKGSKTLLVPKRLEILRIIDTDIIKHIDYKTNL